MKYRFLVFGAGAIGTYLGASLIRQDHTVVFLERAADIQTLWEQGLRVEMEGEVFSIPEPQLIDNLNEIQAGTYDLAILALKTYHLEHMMPDLIRLRDQLPPLLCLQNGVESENILVNALGADRVISGTVTTAVDRLGKGNIVVQRLRGMGLGGPHPLAREFVPIFKQAGINCSYFPRAEQMKWSKLVTNLLGNASSAILDLPPSTIFSHPGLYQMELDQIRETLDVMKFSGIKPVNLPGVPVKLLAMIIKWIPAWISQPLLSKLIGSGRGEKMPSFHKDLYNGIGKSEVDQLNGAVVRAGKKLNIPTPVNDFLVQTLNSLIRGEEKLDKYAHKPELFLDHLAAGI